MAKTHIVSPKNHSKTVCGQFRNLKNRRGQVLQVVDIGQWETAECKICLRNYPIQLQSKMGVAPKTASRPECFCCRRVIIGSVRETRVGGMVRHRCGYCYKNCRHRNSVCDKPGVELHGQRN